MTDWIALLRQDPQYQRARESLRTIAQQQLSGSCEDLHARFSGLPTEVREAYAQALGAWQPEAIDSGTYSLLANARDCLARS